MATRFGVPAQNDKGDGYKVEFINKSDKQFTDISSEAYREYVFASGMVVRIQQPQMIYVSDKGHRVFDANGVSHYIPMGWVHLSWRAKEGQPNFVF